MAEDKPWQSQLPGGGNNIPESYRKRFSIAGDGADETSDDVPEGDLARFLREEL